MQERRLWSLEYFLEKDRAWFMDFHTNNLYMWDLESGELSWIDCFPSDELCFKSHPICAKWQNKVFVFPDFGENVWVYHMTEKNFSKILIGKRRANRYGSSSPFVQGEDIWFPVLEARILHINARTHQCEWFQIDRAAKDCICNETVYKNGHMYLASAQDSILYIFDMEGHSCESYCIEELDGGIAAVCDAGKDIWLSDCTGKIACWDIALRQITRTTVLPFHSLLTSGPKMDVPFLQSRYVKGRVCYIPAHTNPLRLQEAVLFDPLCLSVQTMPVISPKDVEDNYILVEFTTDDGKIGIWTKKNNSILLLDIGNGQMAEKKQMRSKKDLALLWMRSHPVGTERSDWNLSTFLDLIKDDRLQFKKEEHLKEDAGTKIHRAICP